jgi:hypothetical protein
MAETYYTGPCKAYYNAVAFQPTGVQGTAKINVNEKTSDVATAMFGKMGEVLDDVTVEVDLTPFDSWNLLPTLFPRFLGVTTAVGTGFGAGLLAIGTRPHGAANAPTVIYTPDGRLYTIVRTAVTTHPTLTLGSGQSLFGPIKMTGLADPTLLLGANGALVAGNAITETGGADPGYPFSLGDFVRGRWTGAWGTLAGFGGDAASTLEAEDGWQLVPDIKYSPRVVQKLTRQMVLDSVSFMLKGRLVGPTQSQIAAAILAHTQGLRLGTSANAASMVLTGPSGKTITLFNADLKGAGFEFGGAKLGNGEVGFVATMAFTGGVPQPLVAFSA